MSLLQTFLDLIFPRTCSACDEVLEDYEEHICIKCHMKLPKINALSNANELLNSKFWGKLSVKNTYSFLQFVKKGGVQNILHELKYRNNPELATFMGKWFANTVLKESFESEKPDLIIGVPLHPLKHKRRGYNQADEIAKGLSEILQIEYSTTALARNTFTETQTKKSRFKRFENMNGVFSVKEPDIIKGKHIVLVDDVLTTGATLEIAGKELLKADAAAISIITIAAAL